jgi:hypothetical protein
MVAAGFWSITLWKVHSQRDRKRRQKRPPSKLNCLLLLLLLYLTVKGLTNPCRLPSTMYLKKLCASVKNDTISFSKKVTRGGLQRREDAEHASTLVCQLILQVLLAFPSETTLGEGMEYLTLDNNLYKEIRAHFQQICESERITKKTLAGGDKMAGRQ